MSLFGDEDDQPARARSNLFDDGQTSKPKTSSSMFGDTVADADDSSPWSFTPKKNFGRGSLVKSLLADADVPDSYIDTFDSLQSSGNVSVSDARQMLRDCRISDGTQNTIWNLVSSPGESSALGRGEFNVMLALVGLAQEGEELSLDAVDERKRKLPRPSLPAPKPAAQAQQPVPAPQSTSQPGAQSRSPEQRSRATRKSSFGAGFGESDPWGSPDASRSHGHLNGAANAAPQRTTSTFTTGAEQLSDSAGAGALGGSTASVGDTTAWGGSSSYTEVGGTAFGNSAASGDDFGVPENRPTAQRRAGKGPSSKGVEEAVTVNILDEKEGMFMFQHRNYEVSSVRRNSKVIRRYSDFVWLLDCLYKRYPFRQLPLLPPKRVQINGNHIAADSTFLEKRRRGLARFTNALVRHPVLREEQLVVMFLTVPTVDASASMPLHDLITDRLYRNLLSGANRPLSRCKRSLSAKAFHLA